MMVKLKLSCWKILIASKAVRRYHNKSTRFITRLLIHKQVYYEIKTMSNDKTTVHDVSDHINVPRLY